MNQNMAKRTSEVLIEDGLEVVKNEDIYQVYEEVKVVSSGRYGLVWEARRKSDGARFAVKTISEGRIFRKGGVSIMPTK